MSKTKKATPKAEKKTTRPAIAKVAATLRPTAEMTEAELRVQLGVARDNGDATEAADLEARIARLQNLGPALAAAPADTRAEAVEDLGGVDPETRAEAVERLGEDIVRAHEVVAEVTGIPCPPPERDGFETPVTEVPPARPVDETLEIERLAEERHEAACHPPAPEPAAERDALDVEAHLRETDVADIEKELATARGLFETAKKAYQAACAASNVPCRYGDAPKGRGNAVADRVFFETELVGGLGRVHITIKGRPETSEQFDISDWKSSNALAADYCRRHLGDPAVVGNKAGSLGNRLRELFPLAAAK